MIWQIGVLVQTEEQLIVVWFLQDRGQSSLTVLVSAANHSQLCVAVIVSCTVTRCTRTTVVLSQCSWNTLLVRNGNHWAYLHFKC